ncbi:hypothetical protein A374_17214 [Fictibacillus macauensis ZFHKF-1]|uniref:KINB signaling pathway activation protein n=1 Tax=Fictibacillus macauensis ZFHKF-1 TaxID=1196324 RepID=I8UB62_9BACL|nr:DUF2521 family protein [Fictibacillus macauensis]EIT84018.1 hypothetical protein A374_17214 [Fictibacillus macauensis ZFHKF-1]
MAIVITNFREKQRSKKMDYERKVLRDLSLGQLRKEFQQIFRPFFEYSLLYQQEIEDACIDIAIDAYLLGAAYSRFAYHGETLNDIRNRSSVQENELVESLFDYWQFWCWGTEPMMESLQQCCQFYVERWWQEGYRNGEKRYKMRLH